MADNRRTPATPAVPMSTPASRIALIDALEDLLPQTQCTKCGTPGCRPYAEAMADGAPHNRCVPGGATTIAALAHMLQREVLPLDPAFGTEAETRRVCFIREDECIGCTKCLQACPVDAIVGAAKLMHTIISDECTGCDLCIAPCPVDCIEVHHLPKVEDAAERRRFAQHNRQRFQARQQRLAAQAQQQDSPTLSPPSALAGAAPGGTTPQSAASTDKARVIAAALARSNLKKIERKLAAAQAAGEDCTALLTERDACLAEVKRLSD